MADEDTARLRERLAVVELRSEELAAAIEQAAATAMVGKSLGFLALQIMTRTAPERRPIVVAALEALEKDTAALLPGAGDRLLLLQHALSQLRETISAMRD